MGGFRPVQDQICIACSLMVVDISDLRLTSDSTVDALCESEYIIVGNSMAGGDISNIVVRCHLV